MNGWRSCLLMVPLCLALSLPAFAQVDEIEGERKADTQETPPHQTGNEAEESESARLGENTSVGCCIGSCSDACCTFGGSMLFKFVESYQNRIMGKEDSVPRVTGLELMAYGGVNTDTTFALWPRLRLTYGLFSTDFRLNLLLEPGENGVKTYATYDWQILMLNIVLIKPMTLHIGGGVLYEELTNRVFGEFTVGPEFYINDRQWRVAGEYRFAPIRQEGNVYLSYRISSFRGLEFFVSAGGSYSRYYPELGSESSVDSWMAQGGFYMMWH